MPGITAVPSATSSPAVMSAGGYPSIGSGYPSVSSTGAVGASSSGYPGFGGSGTAAVGYPSASTTSVNAYGGTSVNLPTATTASGQQYFAYGQVPITNSRENPSSYTGGASAVVQTRPQPPQPQP